MPQKAPGKAHRKGLTLLEIADMFRDEQAARQWIEREFWPDGPFCPKCGSFNVQANIKHKTATHRCRDCCSGPSGKTKTMFTVRVGTVMEGTRLPYRSWAIAIYLLTTNLKGVSSMKLHRELGITQKSAWFMLHRLRKAAESCAGMFTGPVEADETYIGGKRANMSNAKRRGLADAGFGRGPSGKTAVVGVKDRATKQVRAKVTERLDAPSLQGFVVEHTAPDATVYTDEASAYEGLPRPHESVKHSASEYVRGQIHTNGVESFWSMMKRGYIGIYHKMSPKHLHRYVSEFAGRHNDRESDTADQMCSLVRGMAGKSLTYDELIAPNGLDSGARGG